MANVQFLRGTNAGLKAQNFTPQDGAFYLTTDTNRLYTGIDKGSAQNPNVQLVELNKSIHIFERDTEAVNNSANFEKGQFAFIKYKGSTGEAPLNSLVVYDGEHWNQINNNTYLVSSDAALTVGDVNNKASIISLSLNDNGESTGYDSNHSVTGSFELAVAGNLSLSKSGNKLTIGYDTPSTTNIDLVHSAVTSAESSNPDGIEIEVKQDDSGQGKVQIYAGNNLTLDSTNQNSHIYTINADDMYLTSFDVNKQSGYTFTIQDGKNNTNNNSAKVVSINPQIKENSDVQTAKTFSDDVLILDTYTTSEIDNAILAAKRGMDAMTYKGALTPTQFETKLISATNSIGDTYKAAETFSYTKNEGTENEEELDIHAGDLIIFKTKEGSQYVESQGVIPVTSLDFDIIASGNDYVYRSYYGGTGNTRTFALYEVPYGGTTPNEVDGSDAELGVSITAGTDLNISAVSTGGNITLNHATYNTPTKTGPSDVDETGTGSHAFEAITGLTVNNGHLTGYTTQNLQFENTHNDVDSVTDTNVLTTTGNNANKQITKTIKVTTNDNSTGVTATSYYQTSTLDFTGSTANTMNINLTWGNF